MKGTLRVCKQGHSYYKSSDCPTCPQCTKESKPSKGLLSLLYAPARRALQTAGILQEEDLAKHTEAEIMKLHGVGPSTLPILKRALKGKGLSFRKRNN